MSQIEELRAFIAIVETASNLPRIAWALPLAVSRRLRDLELRLERRLSNALALS